MPRKFPKEKKLNMSNQSRDAEDTMGRSESEMERLMKQFELYDDITRRLFLRSGIAKGMKVLDVGTSAGDIALILSEFVGAEGTVIGVDLNADILETAKARAKQAGVTNIEFIAGDIRTLELPNDFDAVAGRLVLMYMAAPTDVLKHLATHVRPGGIVVFQEVDFTPYTVVHPDTPLMNDLIEWERTLFDVNVPYLNGQARMLIWEWNYIKPSLMRVCPNPHYILKHRWAVLKIGPGLGILREFFFTVPCRGLRLTKLLLPMR